MTAFLTLVATVSVSLALYMVLTLCVLGFYLGCKFVFARWLDDPWWKIPLGLALIVLCLSGAIWTMNYIGTSALLSPTHEKGNG